jgi:Domain of unknown function (DUF4349)
MPSPELARELRAARPVASPTLRERVLSVAARPVEPPRRWKWQVGRLALVAAAALVAAGVGVAVVHGIVSGGTSESHRAQPATVRSGAGGSGTRSHEQIQRGINVPEDLPKASALPLTPTRLQRYGATLRVQVANRSELSDATKRAMRFARLLGGYVATIHYSAPHSGTGSASIVVRVPIDRVQDAVQEYSGYGTLLSQRVSITDVTKAVTEEAKEIARLEAGIAAIEAGGVAPGERPRLEALQARLDFLTKRRTATVRRAELARVSLGLVTKPKRAAAAASRFHRTLGDAGSVLVRELELLVYALVVAGPLLLLGAAAIAAGRLRDRRLFERS